MVLLKRFFIILLFHFGCAKNKPLPLVKLPLLGTIEGYIGLSVTSKPYLKFESIPYAQPPVGELRFEDPVDVIPWTGTWKANVLTRCIQYDHFNQDDKNNYVVHGDEDCLYVNIYTHTIDPTANLDVLVHIHGGAFMFGAGSSYGPDIIMDRNIVFVNLNYRLGPLGFLSTEDNVLPGNLGLKDQNKALKWIKENIKYFGGNPEAITICGLSAGGASVHLHYLMPASKGLFRNGISQSGCALNPWVIAENVKEKTEKLASLVGCPEGTSEDLKQCLKTKPARQIVSTIKEFQPFLYNPFSPFAVVVDGRWASDPVLPDHPYNLLKLGKVLDLPWLVSYVKDEGLYPASDFWTNQQHLIDIDTKWNEIAPFILHYNETVPKGFKNRISKTIRKFYLEDKSINRETFSSFVDIVTDRLFIADIGTSVKLQNKVTKSKIFTYQFFYRGETSKTISRVGSDTNIGVCHGDDTIYILSSAGLDTQSTENDRLMSKSLIDMTLAFMRTGEPTLDIEWKPVDDKLCQLNIWGPSNNTYECLDEIGNSKFWNSLSLRENHNFDIIHEEL